MKKLFLTASMTLLISIPALATSYDSQAWINLTLQGTFSETSSLGGYLELQNRHSNNQKRTFETILRPALFIKTNDFGTFHLGYLTRFNFKSDEIEKRLWTQWLKTFPFESLKISTRARLESRDLNLSERSQRIRIMGRLIKDDMSFFNFSPLASVELFYNLNSVDTSIKSGLQQSRNSIGFNRKFENKLALEFLFTKNYIDSPTSEDQDNNILQIALIKEF